MHLAEIGGLSLLAIFDVLHIPGAVWAETVGLGRVSQTDLESAALVQRHTVPEGALQQFVVANRLQGLHRGELECLFLCGHLDVSLLLTDDLAVRNAAHRLELTPVGSLGIVVRTYRRGHITLAAAEQHIEDLYQVRSLFVTRAIVELAIEQLRAAAYD